MHRALPEPLAVWPDRLTRAIPKEDKMDLRVTTRGVHDTAELRDHAAARVTATLSRFAERVQDVLVLLEDVTGPEKHSIDKRCRIDVHLRHGATLTIDELGPEIEASLAVALDRLKATLSRKIGRVKRGVGAG